LRKILLSQPKNNLVVSATGLTQLFAPSGLDVVRNTPTETVNREVCTYLTRWYTAAVAAAAAAVVVVGGPAGAAMGEVAAVVVVVVAFAVAGGGALLVLRSW